MFGGMAQGLRTLTILAEDIRLGSQHLHGRLQLPITPIPGAHTHMQGNTHIHKVNKISRLKDFSHRDSHKQASLRELAWKFWQESAAVVDP